MKKQEKETKHEVNEGYGGVDPYDYPDILKIILSIILPPLALVYIFAFAKKQTICTQMVCNCNGSWFSSLPTYHRLYSC